MRRPLYLRQVGRRRFTVDGTPTDCVLIAIHQVLKDRPPDLVLSGINRGGNLGEDATYSGTVAAAMEGTLLGIRSIALSQVYENGADAPVGDRRDAGREEVLRRLAGFDWPRGRAAQRQFPGGAADGGDAASRSPGRGGTRSAARWSRASIRAASRTSGSPATVNRTSGLRGTDLAAVEGGAVSVTPLCLDLTHGAEHGRAGRRCSGEPRFAQDPADHGAAPHRRDRRAGLRRRSSGCRASCSSPRPSATRPTRTRRCRSAATRR